MKAELANTAPRPPRWPLAAAIILSLAGAVIALPSYFPAQDEPNHLFTFHALKELGRPDSFVHLYFRSRLDGHYTYIAVERFVLALARFLPLVVADRVMVMIVIVAFPLSLIYFLRRVNPDASLYLLAAPLLSGNWLLHMGFWNQLYGDVAMFLALGYALPRVCALGPVDALALATLLLLAAVIHPIAWVFALGILGLAALIAPPARLRFRSLLVASLAAAPSFVLVAAAAASDFGPGKTLGSTGTATAASWETAPRLLLFFFGHVFFSPRPWALAVEGILLLALFAATACTLWRRRCRVSGELAIQLTRHDWMLAIASAFCALYLICPYSIGEPLAYVPERLPIVIVVLLLGWLRPPRTIRWQRAVSFGLCASAAFFLIENTAYVRQWNEVLREYASAEDLVPAGAKILPIFFSTRGAVRAAAYPMVQAWGYYAVSRDAISPYSFARFPHTAIRYRPTVYGSQLPNHGEFYANDREAGYDAERPDLAPEEVRDRLYETLLADARHYDYVVAWRAPDRFLRKARVRGFATSYARGRLLLLRPPGRRDPAPAAGAHTHAAVPWRL